MMSITLVAIFVTTICLLWWRSRNKKPSGFKKIPGSHLQVQLHVDPEINLRAVRPVGLPIFGNMFQVGRQMHLQFGKWAEKYGNIYQINLGNRKSVVVSDPKWIKEMFSQDTAFAGRQIFEGTEMYEFEQLGIISSEGELWQVHRRFLLRHLRDFGFGKSSMEDMILGEVHETIERMRQFKGGPVNQIKDVFQIAIVNSLWMIVGSKRYQHDNPEVLEILHGTDKFVEDMMNHAIVLFVPWTRYFLPRMKLMDALRAKGQVFYKAIVDEHKATLVPDAPRDFIDVYLNEMEEQKQTPSSTFYGEQGEKQLHVILSDVFFAGTDTTASTLTWAVLYLCKNSHVQEKLQEEIDMVVGNSRRVTLPNRVYMPYTLAVMEETFRQSSIVPTGVQHRANVGKEFKGYFIPEDTWIFPNLYHIHHSPKIWGDPENFRPERFLSSDGKTFKRNENLLPFVVGRRQCIGESLARDSFFLFLTNIFQNFSVRFDPSKPEPSEEARTGFLLDTQPFSVILKERMGRN